MGACVVLASVASRKSIAIAKSIKEILNLKVIGVAHTDHPHVFSRYFDKVHIVRTDRSSVDWVRIVLGIALRYRCKVVLPIDFIDFYMFSKHKQFFDEADVILASPSYESIVTASNRVRCQEALKGVAYFPPQILVKVEKDVKEIYSLRPPLVVKGLSDASNPTFHLSYEAAIEDALSRVPVIIQEYVEGMARGYYALAFNGIPLLEFTHQRMIEYTPIGGASLGARGAVRDPALITLGRGIVRKLKWSGIIMVETRYSDEEGVHYVLELNPKFWGSVDLPETLGYKFSALTLALYLYGYDYALRLRKRLKVKNGSFIWLLDAARYIPKIPEVWFKLVMKAIPRPNQSDIGIADVAKDIVQIVKALKRFKRERDAWIQYLKESKEQLRIWINRYLKFLSSSRKIVILDLDATSVKIPIDWAKLRKKLIEMGLLYPWESINRALSRYWNKDIELYQKLSEIIKHYELKAVSNVRLLVRPRLLEGVRKYARLCIATRQATDVVINILKKFGLDGVIDCIVGRDSGFGPMKKALYRGCVELYKDSEALVIDDGIEYLIEAYRQGHIPMHATLNPYSMARSYRLGIPSGGINGLVSLVISTIEESEQCF